MAQAQGLSKDTIHRIWKRHNLKPHLVETFQLSRDQRFLEKLHDVVGLYWNPPDKALVLGVDEKSQIQALDRTQPWLPLRPGIPARQTHDYQRNRTTTLFAALSMLDGTVIGDCMPRHRHQEFIRFLQLLNVRMPLDLDWHLIVDNYGTHKHPRVQSWLKRHPRFHLHFIPTSSSWLNMVERWFREITGKRIPRGSFQNVPQLIRAIHHYIQTHNQNPKVFVWSASVEKIMSKITKCKEAAMYSLKKVDVQSEELMLWSNERLIIVGFDGKLKKEFDQPATVRPQDSTCTWEWRNTGWLGTPTKTVSRIAWSGRCRSARDHIVFRAAGASLPQLLIPQANGSR